MKTERSVALHSLLAERRESPGLPLLEVVQFLSAAFRQIYTRRTSPETKFGERSSDAVQAYARVRAEHGKRRALPSPEFSLNARIPTLPNCVQEGDFNLASTALENCTTSVENGEGGGV